MWNRDNAVKSTQPNQSPTVQPASPALPVEERRVVVWVGKSVIFKGTLSSSEDMTIDGHVEGTIEVPNHGLTIGPDADIRADILARNVMIHGAVTGNIRASGRVDILATGRIEGDLITPCIVIADGAVIRGRVDTLSKPSDTTKKLAIA